MMNNNNGITLEEALEKLGEKERITGIKNACYLVDKIKNDEDFIAIYQVLASIKQVVENWDEGEYYTDSIRSMKKIEDIIKGEGK